jgi:hypothetical protein
VCCATLTPLAMFARLARRPVARRLRRSHRQYDLTGLRKSGGPDALRRQRQIAEFDAHSLERVIGSGSGIARARVSNFVQTVVGQWAHSAQYGHYLKEPGPRNTRGRCGTVSMTRRD